MLKGSRWTDVPLRALCVCRARQTLKNEWVILENAGGGRFLWVQVLKAI